MGIEKNVVFIFPIAKVLQDLKAKLEKNDQFIIYEMDSLPEYSQIIAILDHSVTFSSDMKKTSRYLQENKVFVRNNQTRNIAVTAKEPSPLAASKLQKFGLNEILTDDVSLRSLEYKIDVFFRPFEQQAKMEQEKLQAASKEMKVLSLKNQQDTINSDEKLRVERMGSMFEDQELSDLKRKKVTQFEPYAERKYEHKKGTLDGLLGSPFDQANMKAKGLLDSKKNQPQFKRANFVEVPRELRQKNGKLDLPNLAKNKFDIKRSEDKSSQWNNNIKDDNDSVDPNEYGMDFETEQQNVNPNDYSLDLDIDDSKNKNVNIFSYDEEDKKKKNRKSVNFDFIQNKNKKKTFVEVERGQKPKKGYLEEFQADTKRRKGFLEEQKKKDDRKRSFFEEDKNNAPKRAKFEEVKKDHNRKNGHLEDFEREKERRKAALDENKNSKPKTGMEFEKMAENKRKKFEPFQANTDKKRNPFVTAQPDFNFHGTDNEEKNPRKNKWGSFKEFERERPKFGKFEEFKPVRKRQRGDFREAPLSKHWGGQNLDKYLAKKRIQVENVRQKKEEYENVIDYREFDKEIRANEFNKAESWIQQETNKLIEELLDEPEYKFFEPKTFGLEYLILIQDFYQKSQVVSTDIFKFISFSLMKSFNAFMSVYIFDAQKLSNEVFCGHKVLGMYQAQEWEDLFDQNIEEWEECKLPIWKDETYQVQINEFIYPLFEDHLHIGFVVSHFTDSIKSHEDAAMAEMLVMSIKGIAYSLYPFGEVK